MNRIDFDNIISNQKEITFADAYKQIMKVSKVCGFLSIQGYDSKESFVKPTRSTNRGMAEIKLIESDDTYSFYLKKSDEGISPYSWERTWFGVYDRYLIKNIGNGCSIVFEK